MTGRHFSKSEMRKKIMVFYVKRAEIHFALPSSPPLAHHTTPISIIYYWNEKKTNFNIFTACLLETPSIAKQTHENKFMRIFLRFFFRKK